MFILCVCLLYICLFILSCNRHFNPVKYFLIELETKILRRWLTCLRFHVSKWWHSWKGDQHFPVSALKVLRHRKPCRTRQIRIVGHSGAGKEFQPSFVNISKLFPAHGTIASVNIWSPRKWSLSLFPVFPHLFAMKWWDQMPWSSFFERWVLSQLFHSSL